MTDLLDALEQRATRGLPRGAAEVFARATSVPPRQPDRPKRLAAALAVAVVAALVAAAVLALRHDEPADQPPVEQGLVDGALFGRATGTTLILTDGAGPALALDLDTGMLVRSGAVEPQFDSNTRFDELTVVDDRLVYVDDAGLATVGFDLEDPVPMPGPVNGRELGSNDVFTGFASGGSGRFWIQSGPLADRPNRAFLAEERSLDGQVVSPPVSLGRTDGQVLGATSDVLIVSTDAGIEVRDRLTQAVVQEPPVFVAAGGERIVTRTCETCPLEVSDPENDVDEVGYDRPIDPIGEVVLSPDGRRLAWFQEVRDSLAVQLVVVDLESGAASEVAVGAFDAGYGPQPVFSPDGEWVFAGLALDDRPNLLGYHVGDDQATTLTLEGTELWSMVAIPRQVGPPGDGGGQCEQPIPAGTACRAQVLGAEPAATTTTQPDDVVASPIEPSQINVVVANGAGVDGAATAIAALLAGLGYPEPIPTDTVVPNAETPLDTVYYATDPDASAQALQVAADLGLSAGAVEPYPANHRPSEIGLAQVLVVLGSSPGMLATSTAFTTTTVPPG
jgi:hypothetical protein